MAPAEKILDRIRKLHAKAISARTLGSEAEAQAFAAKVSEMLAQHKLNMTDLEVTLMEKHEPVAEGRVNPKPGVKRVAWMEELASVIARAHFCRILVSSRSTSITLVGRASDREVAAWMIDWMTPFLWDLSYREMMAARKREKAAGNYYGARGFRTSFLMGFISRLDARFREMRAEVTREAKTGTAMVLINRAEEAVTLYMKQYTKTASSVGQRSTNIKGFEAGARAADQVSLRGGVGRGTTAPSGWIGGGS